LGGWESAEQTFAVSLYGKAGIPWLPSWLKMSAWLEADWILKTNKFMMSQNPANPVYQNPGLSQDFQFTLGLGIKL
jgi:hypothetical protein